MLNETYINLINIILAFSVVIFAYLAFSKVAKKLKSVFLYIIFIALIIGFGEVINLFEVFPKDYVMNVVVNEKEILVLLLLLLVVGQLRMIKK